MSVRPSFVLIRRKLFVALHTDITFWGIFVFKLVKYAHCYDLLIGIKPVCLEIAWRTHMTHDEHYRLGDTVKVERTAVMAPMTPEALNEQLAYAMAGQMHPDFLPKYDLVVLTNQEMVDEYNRKR